MFSIYGIHTARIEKDSTTIQLDHCIIEPNFFTNRTITHESCIGSTGLRTYSKKNYYLDFVITDQLFKYSDPKGHYTDLMNVENNVIVFYIRDDSTFLRTCFLTDINVYGLFKPYSYDIATLSLVAVDPGIIGGFRREKDGTYRKDKNGNYIRIKSNAF